MFRKVADMGCVRSFLADETGAVAVEYGIIAMALFAAIIPAFLYVASGIQSKFSDVAAYFAGSGT
jgi:Flp pilus assembly pilin Flp